MTAEEIQQRIAAVPFWYHRIDLGEGVVTPGINNSALALQMLRLPEDCRGLRALDIGTRDGYFAFELERRGAQVLGIDCVPATESGFAVASSILGSHVEYRQCDLYDLSPAEIGTFDIVLFLGVLYHLPDPIRGLRIVRSLCRERMYLETWIIDHAFRAADGTFIPLDALHPLLRTVPIMQFYPGDSLNGDSTNFWGPNVQCVLDMLGETGFGVIRSDTLVKRGVFECRVKN